MSNHKSGKELVAEFEAAVRVDELYRTSSSNKRLSTVFVPSSLALLHKDLKLAQLRKDLIEICDFSVDQL